MGGVHCAVGNYINSMAELQTTMDNCQKTILAAVRRLVEYQSSYLPDGDSLHTHNGPWYAPDDPTLPQPWKGLVDGSSGSIYYWNTENNITQYEKPNPVFFLPTGHYSCVSAPPVPNTNYHHNSSLTHPIIPYPSQHGLPFTTSAYPSESDYGYLSSPYPWDQPFPCDPYSTSPHNSFYSPITRPHTEPKEPIVPPYQLPYAADLIPPSALASTSCGTSCTEKDDVPPPEMKKSLCRNLKMRSHVMMKRKPRSQFPRRRRAQNNGGSEGALCKASSLVVNWDLTVPSDKSLDSISELTVLDLVVQNGSVSASSKNAPVFFSSDKKKPFLSADAVYGKMLGPDGLYQTGRAKDLLLLADFQRIMDYSGGPLVDWGLKWIDMELARFYFNLSLEKPIMNTGERTAIVNHFRTSVVAVNHFCQVTNLDFGLKPIWLSTRFVESPMSLEVSITGILEHASAVNMDVYDFFLHLDCGQTNSDYWLMSLPLTGWFEKIQRSVEQVLDVKELQNFLLNSLHSLKCFVDANTLPVYENLTRGLGSYHSVSALQMGLYISMHMSYPTHVKPIVLIAIFIINHPLAITQMCSLGFDTAMNCLRIPNANLILLISGMPQNNLDSATLPSVLWSAQNCKDMDRRQPHSTVIIAIVLGVVFDHASSDTHALCYFSSPHSSLASVYTKLQMHPLLHELGLQKHGHEIEYFVMTCTVLALSLLVATMLSKDIQGENLHLIEVALIHTVLLCQPRMFFVEVIGFLQVRLDLSPMRYPSGPIFLLTPIDVHSATNIIFQDELLMTHDHERDIAKGTFLTPPFSVLGVQWFLVKCLLNQLLAVLIGDTSAVLNSVSANPITKWVPLKYKKEALDAIFPAAIFYVAFVFFSQLQLVGKFRPNPIVESPRHCLTPQEILATFWLWLATTLSSLNADWVLHLHGLIEMWFKLLIVDTELNLDTDLYMTFTGEIATGFFNFGAASGVTTSEINMDYSTMCLPHLQELFIEIFAVGLLPYCYSMDAGIIWCSPLWDLPFGQPSQPSKFSVQLDFQVITVLMDMYLKSRGSKGGLLIFTRYMTQQMFGNCLPKNFHHHFLQMEMKLLHHYTLGYNSVNYVLLLVDHHFGVNVKYGTLKASLSTVGQQLHLDVTLLLSFGCLCNEIAYKDVSLVTLANNWSTVKTHVLDTAVSTFLITTIVGKAWALLCIFKIPEHLLTRNFQGLLSSVICGLLRLCTVIFKRFTIVSIIAYIWAVSLAVDTPYAIRNKCSQLIDNSVTNIVGNMTLVLSMLAFIVIKELPVGNILAILLVCLTLHVVVFYFTKAEMMEVGQLASQSTTLYLCLLALLFNADHKKIAPAEDMTKADGHVIFDALITFNMLPNGSCEYWAAKVAFGSHDGMLTKGVKSPANLIPADPSHVAVHTQATWLQLEDTWFNFSLTAII